MTLEQITERVTEDAGKVAPGCPGICCMPMKDRAALHTAVTAVLAIHNAEDECDTHGDGSVCMLCADITDPPELIRTQEINGWTQHVHRGRWCAGCDAQTWPCSTVQAITTALGESDGS